MIEIFQKKDEKFKKFFYLSMHGADWEQVIDNDTDAIIEHYKEIGVFFTDHYLI